MRTIPAVAETNTFEELQPDCGDGFVNLRVDKKRKALLSTYWEMNIRSSR